MLLQILPVLLAGSLVQLSSGLQLPEQYIGCPLRRRAFDRENLVYHLIEYLDLTPDTSPEMVMDQFKSFVNENHHRSDTYDYQAAKTFLELDDGRDYCSVELVYEFLTKYQAYKITNESSMHPEVMLNFLDYYGRRKFPACVRAPLRTMVFALAGRSYRYKKPIKFFKMALALDGSVLSDEFYDKLKRFKPLESEISVDNLAPVCRRRKQDTSAAERIKRKFDEICEIVMNYHTTEMNVLNLANHFDPEKKYFEDYVPIGWVNEMRRACIEIEENGGLLDHIKRFCRPEHDSIFPWPGGL